MEAAKREAALQVEAATQREEAAAQREESAKREAALQLEAAGLRDESARLKAAAREEALRRDMEAQRREMEALRASLGSAGGVQRTALPGTAHSGSPATHSGSPTGAAAAPAGGASGGHSSQGSGTSSPKGKSRKALEAEALEALRAAFAAAAAAAAAEGLPAAKPLALLPALPFPASRLGGFGLRFAHRLCSTIGGALNIAPARADFCAAPGTLELLPAAGGGGGSGMSFFLVTSERPAVVRAAHAFRGAAPGGCYAFPLDALPSTLSLVVDKVQVFDQHGSLVLLHASLAPLCP